MRDLTFTELDTELAEQLPARELMGGCCHSSGSRTNTATAGNFQYGLVNVGNTQVNILAAGNDNGNAASAG